MSASRTPAIRLNLSRKVTIAATMGAIGAGSLAFAVAPGHQSAAAASPAHTTVASAPVAWTGSEQATALHASIAKQQITPQSAVKAQAAAFTKAANKASDDKAAKAAKAAKAHAAAEAKAKAAKAVKAAKAQAAAKKAAKAKAAGVHHAPVYANNLNGWIHESLAIMKKHHIPGSYNGIYRNVMRESSGNPKAINLWDINAQKGIPSKGLLQVIPPTFATYHVAGTPNNIYDPVSNIVAACNYAADKYGSMDNVDSAY
ncbi:transglycosylase SLT domain-containing protein [Streptomyces fuscigenes]|uniref:transglycosylase SLT domain-containing protein n=1 Tax=Streptomyces fuscigenes TaxID=1528880 RepID=UPI001F4316BD|nr:transglycosylase SLT domain-containing protein [Streptomyces fuscigenes]MCF3964235.1 transglycosylase SLT domain-containing protein [Streptomyces fuscigenes]